MRPISRWWKYLFSRVSAACGALTPCSRTFMDEPPRKSGGAEVRGEYVMKSTRSEETRMSVLDDYLVVPKISMLIPDLAGSLIKRALRFAPESGQTREGSTYPLCARSRH